MRKSRVGHADPTRPRLPMIVQVRCRSGTSTKLRTNVAPTDLDHGSEFFFVYSVPGMWKRMRAAQWKISLACFYLFIGSARLLASHGFRRLLFVCFNVDGRKWWRGEVTKEGVQHQYLWLYKRYLVNGKTCSRPYRYDWNLHWYEYVAYFSPVCTKTQMPSYLDNSPRFRVLLGFFSTCAGERNRKLFRNNLLQNYVVVWS